MHIELVCVYVAWRSDMVTDIVYAQVYKGVYTGMRYTTVLVDYSCNACLYHVDAIAALWVVNAAMTNDCVIAVCDDSHNAMMLYVHHNHKKCTHWSCNSIGVTHDSTIVTTLTRTLCTQHIVMIYQDCIYYSYNIWCYTISITIDLQMYCAFNVCICIIRWYCCRIPMAAAQSLTL